MQKAKRATNGLGGVFMFVGGLVVSMAVFSGGGGGDVMVMVRVATQTNILQ